MADNRENSRADDLFDILNEFNDESVDKPVEKQDSSDNPKDLNGDGISSIDEILEILNSGKKEEIQEQAESNANCEEAEIPASIFGHLSDEGDESAAVAELNPHFTDHFSAEEDLPSQETEKEEEEEEEDYDDDDEYEVVSKTRKVGRFFKGMSFIPKAIIYIVLVVIASAYLSYYIITIGNDVFALVTDSREVTITISENDNDETVAQMLVDSEIIEYGWVYELYMKYRGTGDEDTDYIVGTHTLNQSYNYSQIIETLTSNMVSQKVVTVTIPEGYTVDQIIDLLVENGVGQREDYVAAINDYPYKWEFVEQLTELGYSENRKYRLEGYLFPDTYDFYTDTDEVYVINKILNAFYDKFWVDFTEEDSQGNSYQKTLLDKYGMTFDDFIVLASMIQSEGGMAEDFYYISYVFHNRLEHPDSFPKLESDATIQYVLPERLGSAELDTSYDSPYNTYLYNGLPPGAISNPGLEALNAALFPSAPLDSNENEINAYFFVSNDAGKTYYASSRSGHENNVEQVKRDNEAIKAGTYGQ